MILRNNGTVSKNDPDIVWISANCMDMKKDLVGQAGVSHYTMNKLTNVDSVTIDIFGRICKDLDHSVDDNMKFID